MNLKSPAPNQTFTAVGPHKRTYASDSHGNVVVTDPDDADALRKLGCVTPEWGDGTPGTKI